MRKVETTVYEFDELSETAKEHARAWYRESALDYEWWDSTYEDAKRVGLEIDSFDLDRNRHATGKFVSNAEDCAKAILSEHGETCETHKTATAFLFELEQFGARPDDTADNYDYDAVAEYDAKVESASAEFLKSILEDYSIMLQNESEYLVSDENVDESIKINEYEFTEDGGQA